MRKRLMFLLLVVASVRKHTFILFFALLLLRYQAHLPIEGVLVLSTCDLSATYDPIICSDGTFGIDSRCPEASSILEHLNRTRAKVVGSSNTGGTIAEIH